MQEACGLIEKFTRGKSFEDYCDDPLIKSGVERQFEIIGEALSQALKMEPSLKDSITSASSIIAFRNRLIHGYSSVSNRLVWGIIELNLPSLGEELKQLLKDAL